ncbi:MAG: DUF721 domain-containing protein [Abditibacteriota bacterium]|nr:DUF721 domain-containing protein [Abditibacteriota bacterium]
MKDTENSRADHVSDLIRLGEAVGASRETRSRFEEYLRYARLWRMAAGEQIARVSRPYRFTGGILYVRCMTGVWAEELRNNAPEILDRLLGLGAEEIKELRFTQKYFRLPFPAEPAVRETLPEPEPAEIEEARRLAAVISDPELRKAAEKAYLAQKIRETAEKNRR